MKIIVGVLVMTAVVVLPVAIFAVFLGADRGADRPVIVAQTGLGPVTMQDNPPKTGRVVSEEQYGWHCKIGDVIKKPDGSRWVVDGCGGGQRMETQISKPTWTKAEEAAYHAKKKAEFDAEWETIREDKCGGSYRNRKTGLPMGESWCWEFTPKVAD